MHMVWNKVFEFTLYFDNISTRFEVKLVVTGEHGTNVFNIETDILPAPIPLHLTCQLGTYFKSIFGISFTPKI